MAHHGYGRGEYLPLVPIANRWHAAMSIPVEFPADRAAFLDRCRAARLETPRFRPVPAGSGLLPPVLYLTNAIAVCIVG